MQFPHRAIGRHGRFAVAAATVTAALAPASALASHGVTAPISLTPAGVTADGESNYADMTPDGRFVAFASHATDLVAGDTNGVGDVFVRDRRTGVTERVSVGVRGAEGNGDSNFLGIATDTVISDDGRYVAFKSEATNLAKGDRNAATDVFLRDRVAGTTERVSLDDAGREIAGGGDEPAISADGRYVAFTTGGIDSDFAFDVYLRDRTAGTTQRISVPHDGGEAFNTSGSPAIGLAPGGPVVAFSSAADNLVEGDDDNAEDVFVRDLSGPAPVTERISVSSDETGGTYGGGFGFGARSPAISADGRLVAFSSDARNFTSPEQAGNRRDIFVRDREAGTTVLETPGAGGAEADSDSHDPDLGRDGRFLSFQSSASNLVAGSPDPDGTLFDDAFVRDRTAGSTEMVSVASDHADALRDGFHTQVGSGPVTDDGLVSLFETNANTLFGGDGNLNVDVFANDRRPGTDLALTKGAAPDPVAVRGALTYALEARNAGANPAVGAGIRDVLPATVTFVAASAGCTHAAGVVDCDLGTLAAGGSRTVTITVTPRKTGTITNTASVGSLVPDADATNDTASTTTTVTK
jgi:uncharacterized repeat protein (TIGR01451 family)